MNKDMKAIKVISADGAYTELIQTYFEQKFPRTFKVSKDSLLEIITTVLIGDKNVRFGPTPKPEALVKIRATILESIEKGVPIPILVPWGGRKADSRYKLDIAEVSAIHQLLSVDESVRKYYEPGLNISVRIEDLNAYWLYRDENKTVIEDTDAYSNTLVDLITILKGITNIRPVKESCMTTAGLYWETSQNYSDLIYDYLTVSDAYPDSALSTPEWKALQEIGWTGTIPTEQREYYTNRYKKWDPSITHMQANKKLADYFGGSKARLDLKAKGNPDTPVSSYIQLNFTPPVQGAPSSIFSNTLYYRTVSLDDARTHIAPWRAKGYLEIDDFSNRIAMKVTSFGDDNLKKLIESTTTLSNEKDLMVEVDSSHLVASNLVAFAMLSSMPMF